MRRLFPGKKTCLAVLALLVAAGAVGYWQRESILAWHAVSQLARADGAEREACVARVVDLGAVCVPGILDRLEEPAGGDNLAAGLEALAAAWGGKDERTHALAAQLHDRFTRYDADGRKRVLRVAQAMAAGDAAQLLPSPLARSLADLLSKAAAFEDVRGPALRFAATYLRRIPPLQAAALGRGLVETGLADRELETRLAAAQIARGAWYDGDQAILEMFVPLLKDDAPALRIEALKALAAHRDLVGDDDLLPLLHDPEPDIRRVCMLALRSRGLSDEHIALAQLISDDRPAARLQVFERLERAIDLDPGVWVQRLSQDKSEAVRAAAARAAASLPLNMRDRLSAMASGDPSQTVRQVAQFYLKRTAVRER